MKRIAGLLSFLLLILQGLLAQPVTDSLTKKGKDSLAVTIPVDTLTVKKPLVPVAAWQTRPGIPLYVQVLEHMPYFSFGKQPLVAGGQLKKRTDKDMLFYGLMGLLLYFAVLRLLFPKYLSDLWRLFFRTTLKQRQLTEQLSQTPLPSLLFNLLFVIAGGLYAAFLFYYTENRVPVHNFWLFVLYCCAGLAGVYLVKFVSLKATGWVFNVRALTDTYIFIVFIINKVLGIFLLPVLFIVAFSPAGVAGAAWVLSWTVIGGLLLYRYILALSAVRTYVQVSVFHFFLYFCAFEVAPVLVLYKLVITIFK